MMRKEAYNYCLVPGKDMGLGGVCFKTTEKINFPLVVAFSNIIVMILGNYSLVIKTTLALSL